MKTLTPSQLITITHLKNLWKEFRLIVLHVSDGFGRTTMLEHVQSLYGGILLNMQSFITELTTQNPMSLEETLQKMVIDAWKDHEVVLLDDIHLLNQVLGGCHLYPRQGLVDSVFTTLSSLAVNGGKRLVVGIDENAIAPFNARGFGLHQTECTSQDYEAFALGLIGNDSLAWDHQKIHRFSKEINGHHWRSLGGWMRVCEKEWDTEAVIEYFRTNRLRSNIDIAEVQDINLKDLHGVDDILESLEANVVIPLERDDLVAELDLKPKRGVLLLGPPGTGKTSIGRALAHRLKSKFFMLDGNFIAGSDRFFGAVHNLFTMAKANAPSILFIDDGDILFSSTDRDSTGFYRYLLTQLDGLENNVAGRVCVMMTVMDVSKLPPALVRSGRIELWLEMKLPDTSARLAILRQHLIKWPLPMVEEDLSSITSTTGGFTGADLKRLAEEAKSYYALDRVQNRVTTTKDYLERALKVVQNNKQHYADAEAAASARIQQVSSCNDSD